MMKQVIFFIFLVLVAQIYAVNEIVLDKSKSVDFIQMLEENEVFVKSIIAVDVDENQHFYFLDHKLSAVLRLDSKTGKLINTISRLGQGPAELDSAISMRVKDGMVFIADFGFGGVKIFTTEGKLINEFRTGVQTMWLDVNRKNEIFVREIRSGIPVISVYNIDGKKLRTFLKFPVKDMTDKIEYFYTGKFRFRFDSKENLIVLWELKKIVKKFDTQGKLLWEKKVANSILEKNSKPKKSRLGKQGQVYYRRSVFHLEIDRKDNIIVGHVSGGMVINPNGETVRLIKCIPLMNLDLFKLYGNDKKFLRLGVGGRFSINIFDFKMN